MNEERLIRCKSHDYSMDFDSVLNDNSKKLKTIDETLSQNSHTSSLRRGTLAQFG